jgi:uncharacterized repeat protein (TIGR01451 family)
MKRLWHIFIVLFALGVVSCGDDSVADPPRPQGLPDLKVNVTDRPDPVAAGAELTYTVLVRNLALRDEATSVVLTSSLPAGVKFLSSTPAAPSCNTAGGTITCDLGTKFAGTAAEVKIHVRVDPSTEGVITFTASVTADEEETQSVNNTASLETTVQ